MKGAKAVRQKVHKDDRSHRRRTFGFLLTRLSALNRVFEDWTFLRKGRIEGTNDDPKLLYIHRERPGCGEAHVKALARGLIYS